MFSTSIDQRLWIDDSILFTLYCLQTLIGDAMIVRGLRLPGVRFPDKY